MRSTLFFIPHAIGGIPLFGFGIALTLLFVAFIGWLSWSLWSKKSSDALWGGLPIWAIAAAIMVFVLPMVEQSWPDGEPIGLPIRGYGVMVVLGLAAGIGITVVRGRQLGIEPDTVVGLGFWMMVVGVVGARLFFVIQKWDTFAGESMADKFGSMLKLTEGGLVIYGGVIGGLLAGFFYCRRHGLKIAATADLVAPGFLIGLSLGRIGCLLHGCCFGGVCTSNLPQIRFPIGSGPYITQVDNGSLLGIQTDSDQLPAVIREVTAGSPADKEGIRPNQVLEEIRWQPEPLAKDADPAIAPLIDAGIKVDGRRYAFPSATLPTRSLPIHPTQIYSSINACLLCCWVWLLQPFPKRDGIVFCWAILLYAISRFLLEGVRSDEAGQLGTALTISQVVAIVSMVVACLSLILIRYRAAEGRVWNWQNPSTSP